MCLSVILSTLLTAILTFTMHVIGIWTFSNPLHAAFLSALTASACTVTALRVSHR